MNTNKQEMLGRDTPINLLVALREPDGSQLMLKSLVGAAAGRIGMVVTDTAHVAESMAQAKPDVLLLEHQSGDIQFPRVLLHAMSARNQASARVLLLCSECSERHLLEFVRLGGRGCVAADVDGSMLAKAVLRVAEGQVWFPREWLLLQVRKQACKPRRGAPAGAQAASLTPREHEIVSLIGSGMSNKEIARQLGISDKTVQTQLHRVYCKLDAHGRYKAFAKLDACNADSAILR